MPHCQRNISAGKMKRIGPFATLIGCSKSSDKMLHMTHFAQSEMLDIIIGGCLLSNTLASALGLLFSTQEASMLESWIGLDIRWIGLVTHAETLL